MFIVSIVITCVNKCVYIYIYIYRERERHTYTSCEPARYPAESCKTHMIKRPASVASTRSCRSRQGIRKDCGILIAGLYDIEDRTLVMFDVY